jgi:hypothetical protein
VQVGRDPLQLIGLEQLIRGFKDQSITLGHALIGCEEMMNEGATLRDLVLSLEMEIAAGGLDVLVSGASGRLVRLRSLEIIGALNRGRTLQIA